MDIAEIVTHRLGAEAPEAASVRVHARQVAGILLHKNRPTILVLVWVARLIGNNMYTS